MSLGGVCGRGSEVSPMRLVEDDIYFDDVTLRFLNPYTLMTEVTENIYLITFKCSAEQ